MPIFSLPLIFSTHLSQYSLLSTFLFLISLSLFWFVMLLMPLDRL